MHELLSMTGFGQAQADGPLGQFNVELRTVNNRFQDIAITLPRELAALETPLRLILKSEIPRGRIDCRIRFTSTAEAQPSVGLNLDVARAWINQLRQLYALGIDEEITIGTVINLPGVLLNQASTGNDAELLAQLRPVLNAAMAALNLERRREGEALGRELLGLLERLTSLAGEISRLQPEVVTRYREKLRARILELEQDLQSKLDPGRLEMEVALFAERADIAEELARLTVHLNRFRELLTAPQKEPAGKNIEFLLQEIGREINTTCSKARDTSILTAGLEMKSIAEKIREQSANLQ